MAKAVEDLPGIDYIGIYADNIFAVASGNPETVRFNLENLDHTIQLWAKEKGAVIPTNKAEILHVCRKRSCNVCNIRIGIYDLQTSEQMRILGLIFTRNLLWNTHVNT